MAAPSKLMFKFLAGELALAGGISADEEALDTSPDIWISSSCSGIDLKGLAAGEAAASSGTSSATPASVSAGGNAANLWPRKPRDRK
jgi:hypothetical protein